MDTLKIRNILNKEQTLVLVCKSKASENLLFDLCRDASKKSKNICVITVNQTYSSIIEKFRQKKINSSRFQFVDCISAKYMSQVPSKQCTYISSPRALTEMAIVLSQLAGKTDLMIFDNINSLFLYNGEVLTLRFLNSLAIRLRKTSTKAVCFLMGETKREMLADLSLFADKIIEV